MKLTPGLGVSYTIQPGNAVGLFYSFQNQHRARDGEKNDLKQRLKEQTRVVIIGH